MRISKRVSFTAYKRTLDELLLLDVDITKLPDYFYRMHWSERRLFLQAQYGLFMCPRCRTVIRPEHKHPRMQLCEQCGDNTAHNITHLTMDEEHVAASGIELPTLRPRKPTVSVDDVLKIARGIK